MNINNHLQIDRHGRVAERHKSDKGANEIFREVKLARHDLVKAHEITDKELMALITRIKSGIRNVRYLAVGEDFDRLHDIAAHIVREYTY